MLTEKLEMLELRIWQVVSDWTSIPGNPVLSQEYQRLEGAIWNKEVRRERLELALMGRAPGEHEASDTWNPEDALVHQFRRASWWECRQRRSGGPGRNRPNACNLISATAPPAGAQYTTQELPRDRPVCPDPARQLHGLCCSSVCKAILSLKGSFSQRSNSSRITHSQR